MCEFSEKLVAWLDRELPADEAARLERHLHSCSECPRRIAAYEEVSTALVGYCDSVIAASSTKRPSWTVLAGTGAVAAALLILSILPHSPTGRSAIPPPPAITPAAIAFEQTPVAVRKAPRRRAGKPGQVQNATPQFAQPEIEIAIPAEALFPPGAVPEGFQFVADISIGADGSAQSLRLRPY
jgi:anti-sigma factor RsiW